MPERDPHPEVHEWLSEALQRLDVPLAAGAEVVRFELRMLAELGFGLDLTTCAATGEDSDLGYVSPKSGRAVSRGAGEPWHDRLLRLPAFVTGEQLTIRAIHRPRISPTALRSPGFSWRDTCSSRADLRSRMRVRVL